VSVLTKDMTFQQVLSECPESVSVFAEFGLGCIGCAMASFETIEQGAVAHGIDADKLMEAINAKVSKLSGHTGCSCCGGGD
jgi:hybrid cluster-associated redox disulfide protein